MRYGCLLEDAMLVLVLKSPCLKRVVLLGAVGKMVSVDIAFSYEATVSFGCSFSSDIFLYFQSAWGMVYSEIPKSHQFCRKRGLRIICLIVQKILSPLIF